MFIDLNFFEKSGQKQSVMHATIHDESISLAHRSENAFFFLGSERFNVFKKIGPENESKTMS
jgi:hypothetical protein